MLSWGKSLFHWSIFCCLLITAQPCTWCLTSLMPIWEWQPPGPIPFLLSLLNHAYYFGTRLEGSAGTQHVFPTAQSCVWPGLGFLLQTRWLRPAAGPQCTAEGSQEHKAQPHPACSWALFAQSWCAGSLLFYQIGFCWRKQYCLWKNKHSINILDVIFHCQRISQLSWGLTVAFLVYFHASPSVTLFARQGG